MANTRRLMWGCTWALWGCASVDPAVDELGEPIGAPSGLDPAGSLAASSDVSAFGGVLPLALGLGFTPLSVEPADMDGDGTIDLLVSGVGPAANAVGATFLGNGDGTFAPGIDAQLDTCSAFPVVGNLDPDGRSDVVALGCGSNLAVLLGQGDGALTPWPAWPAINYGSGVINNVIADFEGDGDADVITLRLVGFNPVLSIDVAVGNGGVGIWNLQSTVLGDPDWSGFDPTEMVVANLDGDGLLDLVLTDRGHDVTRLLGTPPASFAFPLQLGVDVSPWMTRVGDLDGDGLDELVVVSREDAAVQVWTPLGDGSLVPLPPTGLSSVEPFDATLADLDADGDLDLAVVDETQRWVWWMQGDGAGAFGSLRRLSLPSGGIRVHAAELNGDGLTDLIVATFDDDSVSVLLGTP